MGKTTLAVLMLASFHALFAQSVLFVSPSTKGLLSMTCAAGSLDSFEELHFLAATHELTERLCPQAHIDAVAGLWKGQAENSGMVDGCPAGNARALGALLAKHYHQKAALVFDRAGAGKQSLVSFRVKASLGVLSARLSEARVSGGSVLPRAHDSIVVMVVTNALEQAHAKRLYALVRGQGWKEEAGTAELIGDDDRTKARDVYDRLIAGSPAEVQQLDRAMYSEKFDELGTAQR